MAGACPKSFLKLRISQEELNFLANEIKSILPDSKLYLFGSRVDDNKKGGDIDILILSENKLPLSDKMKIKRKFYQNFGEQKLDLVSFTYSQKDPFKELILSEPIIEFTL